MMLLSPVTQPPASDAAARQWHGGGAEAASRAFSRQPRNHPPAVHSATSQAYRRWPVPATMMMMKLPAAEGNSSPSLLYASRDYIK